MKDNADPKRSLSSAAGQKNVQVLRDKLIEVEEPSGVPSMTQMTGPTDPPVLRNSLQVGAIAPGAIPRGKNPAPKKMESAKFLSVMVDDEDKKLLATLSVRRGVSISSMTRQAIKDYLAPLRGRKP